MDRSSTDRLARILGILAWVTIAGVSSAVAQSEDRVEHDIATPAPNATAQSGERRVEQLRFEGLEAITSDVIVKSLKNQPEIYEAAHRSVDDATYIHRVQEAVERGMLASGFLDARVEVVSDSDPVTVKVKEGPRFRRGAIRVSGANPLIHEWVQSKLMTASKSKEDASPIWEPGKPAGGTLFGSMARVKAVRDRLTEIGLHGDLAKVELVRNETSHEQVLVIELAEVDGEFTFSSSKESDSEAEGEVGNEDANGPENKSTTDSNASPSSVERALRRVHERWFAKATPGIYLRVEDDLRTECWFGNDLVAASIEYGDHVRTVVFDGGELQFNIPESGAAIRIPVPNASILLQQKSTTESEDRKTMSIVVGGSVSSKDSDNSAQFGLVFTPDAWREWFPPEETQQETVGSQTTFTYEDRRLRIDKEHNLIDLKGSDLAGRPFVVEAVKRPQIRAVVDEFTADVDPIQLFAKTSETGQPVALSKILDGSHHLSDPAAEEEDLEFRIPPASGQSDWLGMVILVVVNDGHVVDPDSLIGRFAKLYALELSGHRRSLLERITEIEPEALPGAATSAVLGDLMMRQGKGGIERATRYFYRSVILLDDPDAMAYDVQVLVNESNLLGRVAQEMDVKLWLRTCYQAVQPWAGEDMNRVFKDAIDLLPEATNADERLGNVQRVTEMGYKLVGKAKLKEYIAQNFGQLKARRERLAKKKDSKKTTTRYPLRAHVAERIKELQAEEEATKKK